MSENEFYYTDLLYNRKNWPDASKDKTILRQEESAESVFLEIKQLIEEARQTVAVAVNAATTILYWNIGQLVNNEILENKRAAFCRPEKQNRDSAEIENEVVL